MIKVILGVRVYVLEYHYGNGRDKKSNISQDNRPSANLCILEIANKSHRLEFLSLVGALSNPFNVKQINRSHLARLTES